MLQLCAYNGLPQLVSLDSKKRTKFITENRNFVRHDSLAALMCDNVLAALVTICRDEKLLSRKQSIIYVRINGSSTMKRALTLLKKANHVSLVQLNTVIFAYKPILERLQSIKEIPLTEDILLWSTSKTLQPSSLLKSNGVMQIVTALQQDPQQDLQQLLRLGKSVTLDASQADCLVATLSQSASLVQGPPD